MSDAPHSALYLTPLRDHWHSAPQLARCVAEWGMAEARDVRAGLRVVGACQVERVHPAYPPYETEDERLAMEALRDFVARGITTWPRAEARRYYAAGAPEADDFERLYDRVLDYECAVLTQMEQGTYTCTGGSVHYLVCAQRS